MHGFSGDAVERQKEFRKLCKQSLALGPDEFEQQMEQRARLVDQMIREFNLQIPPRFRPNLRPVASLGTHRNLTDLFGDFYVCVTDGLQTWVQLATGQVVTMHWTNIVLPKEVKDELERPKKPKHTKPKKLTKTQTALMETLKELGIV